ncbi:hypothetical protein SG34_019140 [Thalassomonas viridans]|uniref:Uncharacterized protein n=1 Tax=Thalassomonas viridans TaxID=137584 RepID=A0AAF0C7M5_9GAMM|nr:hypothetical protein [Thalassomonas viridans]WDE03496.1 hypothetical protein SG34_019140 [Thalassomonas viridans]
MNVNALNLYAPATRTVTTDKYQKLSGEVQANSSYKQTDSLTISPAARAAAQGKSHETDPVDRYQALASNQAVARSREATEPAKVSREDFMKAAIQGTVDQRLGLDREKLQELEAKMKQVAENDDLTAEQKAEQLAALQQQIDEITQKAAETTFRQEQVAETEKALEQVTDKI